MGQWSSEKMIADAPLLGDILGLQLPLWRGLKAWSTLEIYHAAMAKT